MKAYDFVKRANDVRGNFMRHGIDHDTALNRILTCAERINKLNPAVAEGREEAVAAVWAIYAEVQNK